MEVVLRDVEVALNEKVWAEEFGRLFGQVQSSGNAHGRSQENKGPQDEKDPLPRDDEAEIWTEEEPLYDTHAFGSPCML